MHSPKASQNCHAKQPDPPKRTCCGPGPCDTDWPNKITDESWIVGSTDTPTGSVTTISTVLRCADRHGAWILVLDTNGINVWCAAGKGTFGTDELVHRAAATRLAEIVSHKRLIVPQLAAPGVAADEVRKQTGFRVVYGPIRAEDIRAFLQNNMKATPRMRLVEFPFRQRLAVAPVELVMSAKYVLIVALALLLLAGLGPGGYLPKRVFVTGIPSALLFAAAFVAGTILTPALLPWLPGRALSLKGFWVGIALLLGLAGWVWATGFEPQSWATVVAWCLIVPLVTSFAAMNFTGSTTYTSLSGVRREMRFAVPIQIVAATIGIILWIVGRFV